MDDLGMYIEGQVFNAANGQKRDALRVLGWFFATCSFSMGPEKELAPILVPIRY